MAWYYSPNQIPTWVNETCWTNTTSATSTAGAIYYDAAWNLGTTGATTVATPTFWIRRGLAPTVQQAETLGRLIDYTAQPPPQQRMVGRLPAPPISPASPAIIREREALAQRRVEQMRASDQACRTRREAFEAAQLRARELLLEHLTPEQRETFVARGWFVVEGKRQRYRIETNRGYTGNIVAMGRRDEYGQRYCAHCDPGVAPGHDQFLAQKFMLEHAEEDFLRIANRH